MPSEPVLTIAQRAFIDSARRAVLATIGRAGRPRLVPICFSLDPERPVVPNHEVRTEGSVLHYEIVRPEAPNTDDFPVFANEDQETPLRRSRYELHLHYTIVLRLS